MTFTPGSRVGGFVVRRVAPVKLMSSVAIELEHEASGCSIIHISNADTENLFSVTFRTPPPNNTGLPHIMEHSVLAGSARYRGKDPFFALVKSSVASFINAMTAYDHTLYPVSSTVRQDLFNLADVYWDAVFHPLLTEHTFGREGHRTEFAKAGDLASPLIRRGIVYSEMQGVYSSPDSLVWEATRRNILPDSPYGLDSGGDPDRIPELTYEQYRAFHERYYHPSNALVFVYGNVRTEDYLAFLEPRLSGSQRRPPQSPPPRQRRWNAARTINMSYPAAPEEADRAYLVLSWLYGDGSDPLESMALQLLSRVLIGNEAAPLRKAIIDAKIGDDLALSGPETDTYDSIFAIGVKGSTPDRAPAFVELVERTLRSLSEGVRREAIEAAAQQLAYHTLAISENFPVHVLFRMSAFYAQHRDPLPGLDSVEHLREVRERAISDPSFLPGLIRKRLLENPHRLQVIARADPSFAQERDAEAERRLAEHKSRLSSEQLSDLAQRQEQFEREEAQPEQKDALAALPMLKVTDLPKRPRQIPTKLEREGNLDWLENAVFANGINYVAIEVDLSHVPLDLLSHAAVYAECLPKMGAGRATYEHMAERIAAHTSGVAASVQIDAHATSQGQIVRTLQLGTSFLDGQAASALSILEDLLFEPNPTDVARLTDVLVQAHAAERSFIGREGDRLARAYAASVLSPESWLSNRVQGLSEIRLFADLAARTKTGAAQIALEQEIDRLLALRRAVSMGSRIYASFTGSGSERAAVRGRVGEWAKRIGRSAGSEAQRATGGPDASRPSEFGFTPPSEPLRVGLAAPMDVAFCVYALPGPAYSDPQAPTLAVAAQHMSLTYVLDEVRFKGAAYGGWLRADLLHKNLMFGSYRDPSIARTLGVFEGAASALKAAAAWSQRDLDRTILVAAKDSLKPNRPREATSSALYWHVHGLTDEVRAAFYDSMLSVTAAEAKRVLASELEGQASRAATCVVSSRAKLENENRDLQGKALGIEDIFPAT